MMMFAMSAGLATQGNGISSVLPSMSREGQGPVSRQPGLAKRCPVSLPTPIKYQSLHHRDSPGTPSVGISSEIMSKTKPYLAVKLNLALVVFEAKVILLGCRGLNKLARKTLVSLFLCNCHR